MPLDDANPHDAAEPVDLDQDGAEDRVEMLLASVFALAAASVARKAAGALWRASTGRTPPSGGRDDRSSLAVLVMWGAVAGAAGGAARLMAERQARRVAAARRERSSS
jgi:hypothetical protein